MITYKNRLPVVMGVGYISAVPHKTGAGIGTPLTNEAHNRASGFFTCKASSHLFRIMVGRMGPLSGGPGPSLAGSSNPVRLTTLSLEPLGGELSQLTNEGYPSCQTASIPALTLTASTHRPRSIVVCSAPIPSPGQCISISCVMRSKVFHRITSPPYSATWPTICAVYKNFPERRRSSLPEKLTSDNSLFSIRWWGFCLSDIREVL